MPPEDCGGARAYMEAGDPRWRVWWEALPREELRRMAEAAQRFFDSGGDRSAIGDCEGLSAALERVEAHRALRPDRLDRRAINRRLHQYARGERAWLFCDTVGG